MENNHPPILTRKQAEAIQALKAQRKTDSYASGSHRLSQLLYCPECGHTFRRLKTTSRIFWKCCYMTSGRSSCTPLTVEEDDVCLALINMINKLRASQTELLEPLIQRLERLQSKACGAEVRIYEIDKEIAALSSQSLVIAELLSNRILDSADFTAQSSALAEQIRQLRIQRRQHLNQSENDSMMTELREISGMISDMESDMTEFDEEIIRAVVDRITIISDTEIKIRLRGGLEITEHLPLRRRRRKQAWAIDRSPSDIL